MDTWRLALGMQRAVAYPAEGPNDQHVLIDNPGRVPALIVDRNDNTTTLAYTSGQLTSVTDPGGRSLTFSYDGSGRITQVTYPNDDEVSYAYDANGNRTTVTVNGTPTSYTYDDADQMTQAGGTSYTYDANGNQTDRGDDTFSYDYENRLVEATVGETTSSFTYNGLGLRVSKTVGENTTDYVWSNSGSLPVVVYDGNYYVYGLGLIAKTDSQDGQLYYLADGLASTTGLTDGEANLVGTYTYDVFGAIRSETGGQANDYRFTGQQLDVQHLLGHSTPAMVRRYSATYDAEKAARAHERFSPADRMGERLG
jgi:YD repeat-containing protein